MISKIVVPLDGSMLAESVLPHVIALGRAALGRATLSRVANAQVTLLHVVEAEDQQRDHGVDFLDRQLRQSEATAYLNEVAARLERSGIPTRRVLLEGKAAQQIISYVREQQPDLLILSSHGESGLEGWNLSGVVQKVIQMAKVSFLLVRAHQAVTKKPTAAGYRRVMVALDGSPRAELALAPAVVIARYWDAELLLTHVVARPQLFSSGPTSLEDKALVQQFVKRNRAAAAKYLAQIQSHLPVRSQVRLHTSENILGAFQNIVENDEVDLMVCTAHGHGCHREQLYGGLVNTCLFYGCVPILVVQDLRPAEMEPTRAEEIAQAREAEDISQLTDRVERHD